MKIIDVLLHKLGVHGFLMLIASIVIFIGCGIFIYFNGIML